MSDIFVQYREFYEKLTEQNLHKISALVAPDIHFKDPFNDVRGVDQVLAIFGRMLKDLRNPRFEILEQNSFGSTAIATWRFSFSHPLLSWGSPITISGVSEIRADAQGRISEHIDYWDAASQVFVHIPILGWIIRLLLKIF